MSMSTHVLDTAAGRPAAGVAVVLEAAEEGGGGAWRPLRRAATDGDGRVRDLVPPGDLREGTYRLTFATGAYFAALGQATFWPRVTVEFAVTEAGAHHHVPLLVSPHGYTTYRGS